LDEDGHLDHLLLWIPRGFEATVLEVLRSLRKTYTKGEGELSLNFVGSGLRTDFLKTEDADSTLSSVLGGSLGSRTWESLTPFFVNRYVKKRGKNSLEGQVRRELEQRGLPEAKIDFLCTRNDRFRRFRSYIHSDKKHSPRIPQSFALRLRFVEPISGPICLGYGSHQGLGLFKAVKDE
ncbi:MAG: type I-U CRISPR-associated protein Csb2, partial [Planctomycetota bacterium]|nr:type I-U CRISPR-associated protein Csb2 [Planctomycetota bacterium]